MCQFYAIYVQNSDQTHQEFIVSEWLTQRIAIISQIKQYILSFCAILYVIGLNMVLYVCVLCVEQNYMLENYVWMLSNANITTIIFYVLKYKINYMYFWCFVWEMQ